MLSKIIGYIVNTPLHDVQRELIKEQTRRLKHKTDLFEKRQARRDEAKKLQDEINNRERLAATVIFKLSYKDRPCEVQADLFTSKKQRLIKWRAVSLKVKDENSWNRYEPSDLPTTVAFVKRTDSFMMCMEWLNSSMSLSELEKAIRERYKTTARIELVDKIINKKKEGS